jgi:hypothetical protein
LDINKGDKASLKKPKCFGEIVNIFRDTTSDNYGCSITLSEWNPQDEEKLSNPIQ